MALVERGRLRLQEPLRQRRARLRDLLAAVTAPALLYSDARAGPEGTIELSVQPTFELYGKAGIPTARISIGEGQGSRQRLLSLGGRGQVGPIFAPSGSARA